MAVACLNRFQMIVPNIENEYFSRGRMVCREPYVSNFIILIVHKFNVRHALGEIMKFQLAIKKFKREVNFLEIV